MDRGDPGPQDWRGGYAGAGRLAAHMALLKACSSPASRLIRVTTALASAVAGVAGLLSALVAAGIIHAAPAPPPTLPATRASAAFVVYSTEGLRLRLGQCFNLDTGLAQCGEEDIALPQRQVGALGADNGAELSELGVRSLADYNALDAAELQGLSYSSVRTVPLEAGLLLAVKTHGGNYAKLWLSIVQTPDYTLKMKTYHIG